ncbi:MAG: NAD(P)-dependent oxidoreductase [Candidatus Latescibacterota bacterium]|nr:NAD(P)-dependent oxidoreductase [Candidatus Latescibacterota bacterium]
MGRYQHIGITGANGKVGRVLLAGLRDDYDLRAITRRQTDIPSTIVAFDNPVGLVKAFNGLDAIIHLGANPSPGAEWNNVRDNNIDATYNVFDACVKAGVKRMIFASTNHTMHGHTLLTTPATLDPSKKVKMKLNDPPNPDSLYAVSKLFGEQIGKLYSERHGLSFVGMRIGWLVADNDPKSKKGTEQEDYMRAMWLSHRDCVEAHRCAVEVETEYQLAYVISNNDRRVFDLEETTKTLGYKSKDNAEDRW